MTEGEKQTQDLFIALAKLEKTQEAALKNQDITTDNVNKLVTHIEKLLPVHTDISNIKKILYSFIAVTMTYISWNTLFVVEMHEKQSNLIIASEEIKKKSDDNKNQITYLKGAKLVKPKRYKTRQAKEV